MPPTFTRFIVAGVVFWLLAGMALQAAGDSVVDAAARAQAGDDAGARAAVQTGQGLLVAFAGCLVAGFGAFGYAVWIGHAERARSR